MTNHRGNLHPTQDSLSEELSAAPRVGLGGEACFITLLLDLFGSKIRVSSLVPLTSEKNSILTLSSVFSGN